MAGVLALNVVFCFVTKDERPVKSFGIDTINHPEIFDGEKLQRILSMNDELFPHDVFDLIGAEAHVFKLAANAFAFSNDDHSSIITFLSRIFDISKYNYLLG